MRWLSLAALLSACGSSSDGAPASSTVPPHPSASSAPASSVPASTAPSATTDAIAEADVRTLVDAWLAAQNAGDFPAYEALYGARFDGIRRSGPRTRRFDRAGWMADRRTMFSRPMHVEAREVSVTATGSAATVRLVQSFTEGRYHDEGPKELVVVREGGGLRIVREEMLASSLSAASAASLAAGALMPVVRAGETRFAVLAVVPDGASWSEGAPELLVREGVVVTRERASSAVPASLAAIAQGEAVLSGADGATCDAHLGALAVISRVDVHFSVEQRWSGQNDDGTEGTPATPAQIAADAWGEGRLLVASIDGACPDATYARLASLPAVTRFSRTPADAALTSRVRAAFRALPAWTALDEAFHEQASREDGAPRARWDEPDTSTPAVEVWSAGERRLAVIGASVMEGGCADFSGALWAVFAIDGETLTPLTSTSDPGYFAPLGAVDVDGDGRPEWVVEQGVVGAVDSGLGLVEDLSPAMHDCDC